MSAAGMCGFVGYFGPVRDAEPLLEGMTAAIAHRGPDERGYLVSPEAGLGHARLSVVGLGDGQQPMSDETGSLTIAFNGEIFNYVELREDLRARGRRFRTASDTEVILHLYDEMGEDCLRLLNGDFAFALWDRRRRRMMLARDRMGVRPLFHASSGGTLYFASEIKALLRVPGISARIDPLALDQIFTLWAPLAPRTAFADVQELEPASVMTVEQGRTSIRRYWSLDFPPSAAQSAATDETEAAVQVRELLTDAVRLRMRADVPVGSYLSGGLDSSLVSALAAGMVPQGLDTFSVTFDSPEHDESAYQTEMAAVLGTRHHAVACRPGDIAADFPEVIRFAERPILRTAPAPLFQLSRLVRESGLKVVLTGEGADELLGGYPKHRAEPWVARYQRLMPGSLHDLLVAPATRALPYAARRMKTVAGVAGIRDRQARMVAWFGGANSDQAAALYAGPPQARALDPLPFAADGAASALKRMLHFDQTSWLPDNLLERGDRMMMAGSIEGRMPFMDVGLAELAARFPDAFLTGAPKGKRVLRALAAKLLPRDIIERRKVGFRVPVEQWFRTGMADQLRDLLQSGDATIRQLCKASEIDRLVNEHLGAVSNHEKILWALANLEQFFRVFRPAIADVAPQGHEAA